MYAPNFYGGNGIVGAQVSQSKHTNASSDTTRIFLYVYRYPSELALDLHSSTTSLTRYV